MNPAFIFLVIIIAIVLWFILSFIFFPLGKFLYRIWKNAIDKLNKEEEKKGEDNEKE